jgi:hypothetical protein
MSMEQSGPGPVELAVESELAGLAAARERPGLAQVALSLARLMDGPAVTSKPAAAKQLMEILGTLAKGGAQGRRKLAVVKQMTEKGGAWWLTAIGLAVGDGPDLPFVNLAP